MDNISQNKAMCCVRSCIKKLCSMKIKDDLDFSMSLTADEDDGEKVYFDKKIKSNTEFSLCKALGAMLVAGVCVWVLCFLWSLCCIFKKK